MARQANLRGKSEDTLVILWLTCPKGMFELLEADIVVFQETKIQRKDLKDDMVLVPGWDCYWSLPKHKKGRK